MALRRRLRRRGLLGRGLGAGLGAALGGLRGGRLLEPALEALDTATGVHELLLARVEGVALRAELDAQGRCGRPGRELVAARAVDLALDVLGVDLGLHKCSIVTGGDVPTRSAPNKAASQPIPVGAPIPFRWALLRSRRGTRGWSACGAACRSGARARSRPRGR